MRTRADPDVHAQIPPFDLLLLYLYVLNPMLTYRFADYALSSMAKSSQIQVAPWMPAPSWVLLLA